MSSRRIVVLISGSGSNMRALVEACRADLVPGDVVAVGADRDCTGLLRARDLGIETFLMSPKAWPDREA